MLVFVDEAGDPGFEFDKNSSEYFSMWLVGFEDHDEANTCDSRIESLKSELGKMNWFEFHYRWNSDKIRKIFFEAISNYDFLYYWVIINKKLLMNNALRTKNSFYEYAASIVFENARNYLMNATIICDSHGGIEFKRLFQRFLRKKFNDNWLLRIKKIKIQKSHTNNLLQLADYITSSLYQKYYKPHKPNLIDKLPSDRIKIQILP